MPKIDPALRAETLRATAEALAASARRAHGGDHPLRGTVRYAGGTYRLSHLGVTDTSTVGPAGAMLSWCDAAERRAKALSAQALEPVMQRLPQVVRGRP